MKAQKLLSIGNDSKTVKGEARGYRTAILYLSPANLSGRNLCPWSTEGCRAACPYTAGRGIMASVHEARLKRTMLWVSDPETFLNRLADEIDGLWGDCLRDGMHPAVRLNGTADVAWERVKTNGKTLFEMFPAVSFYDYTKSARRATDSLASAWHKNYKLTLSRSESNHDECFDHLWAGGNISVVFAGNQVGERFSMLRTSDAQGLQRISSAVVDGDKDDLRFLDPSPCVVGLRAKGKARQDTSGFVIR